MKYVRQYTCSLSVSILLISTVYIINTTKGKQRKQFVRLESPQLKLLSLNPTPRLRDWGAIHHNIDPNCTQ